jgi:hypothetical protein
VVRDGRHTTISNHGVLAVFENWRMANVRNSAES